MTTIEECEARIRKDPKLMRECLNDNDFAGWLVSSIGPMDNDALEFGERVRDYINGAVTAYAEAKAKEDERDAKYHEYDDTEDRRLDDPRHGQAKWINAGGL